MLHIKQDRIVPFFKVEISAHCKARHQCDVAFVQLDQMAEDLDLFQMANRALAQPHSWNNSPQALQLELTMRL